MSRPNREPDYISKAGTYFWFNELCYLNATGSLMHLEVCEKSSRLRIAAVHVNMASTCNNCDACNQSNWHQCDRFFLKKETQEAYKEWLINAFEKEFLNEE